LWCAFSAALHSLGVKDYHHGSANRQRAPGFGTFFSSGGGVEYGSKIWKVYQSLQVEFTKVESDSTYV
jgi:hypothetical protein